MHKKSQDAQAHSQMDDNKKAVVVVKSIGDFW